MQWKLFSDKEWLRCRNRLLAAMKDYAEDRQVVGWIVMGSFCPELRRGRLFIEGWYFKNHFQIKSSDRALQKTEEMLSELRPNPQQLTPFSVRKEFNKIHSRIRSWNEENLYQQGFVVVGLRARIHEAGTTLVSCGTGKDMNTERLALASEESIKEIQQFSMMIKSFSL